MIKQFETKNENGNREPSYYSPKTFSKIFDVTLQAVRNWILSGRIQSIKIGRNVRISAIELNKRLSRVNDGTGEFLD